MAFTSTVLELEIADHIATLWLSRAEARNAMGSDLWRDLPLAAAAIAENREVRCVVIAARGPHFTVGLDLKEMGAMFMTGGNSSGTDSKAMTTRKLFDRIQEIQQAITCFDELEVPVIAAIHGYCIGGGIDLVTAADFRLASSDATPVRTLARSVRSRFTSSTASWTDRPTRSTPPRSTSLVRLRLIHHWP